MKLYKYVSPERLDILTKNTIRFTQPLAWNDPFELRPSYENDSVKEPLMQIAKFIYILKHFQQTGEALTKETDEFERERKRITKDDIYRFINDNVVGLSLTEDKENLLMWSHYARQHKGFVIEFDTEHEFFKTNDRFLFKVKCGNLRPRIDINAFSELIVYILHSLKNRTVLNRAELEKISKVFKKSEDWEYEKEWRLISATQNANNYSLIENTKTYIRLGHEAAMEEFYCSDYIALFHLPISCITAIYFGLRIPNNIPKEVFLLQQKNSNYSHIKLFYTKLDNELFKFNFHELQDVDVLTLGELQTKKAERQVY